MGLTLRSLKNIAKILTIKKRLSYGPSRQECTKCLTLEILGHKHNNDSTDTAFMDPRARVSQVKWK